MSRLMVVSRTAGMNYEAALGLPHRDRLKWVVTGPSSPACSPSHLRRKPPFAGWEKIQIFSLKADRSPRFRCRRYATPLDPKMGRVARCGRAPQICPTHRVSNVGRERRGARKCVRAQLMTATASISTRKSGPAESDGTGVTVLAGPR